MTVLTRHISDFLEHLAPNATKMDYDNTGLLVGNYDQQIENVLTCLDVTPAVIDEAIQKNVQLIVAHHPLIFPKLKRVISTDPVGGMVQKLIRNNISLIASHTNLDAARSGVSKVLCDTLGLTNCSFLDDSYKTMRRVILRIPSSVRDSAESVVNEFTLDGSWTVDEDNSSMVCFNIDYHHTAAFKKKLAAALEGAPYSLDEVSLEGSSPLFGFGMVGYLEKPMPTEAFLDHVKSQLGAEALRWSGSAKEIKKVAVCGGSGSSLIRKALGCGADAFVTADIKYHDFFVPDNFLLIDAGHYETEVPIVHALQKRIKEAFPDTGVFATEINTNPMRGLDSPV
ncbi:MAG: Nif3-like dinuclear metal center hexameric protein [Balneolia bacterium]|nr:Nif3-like dinuclear metal center hexameric protein [Balneolia bacterium]